MSPLEAARAGGVPEDLIADAHRSGASHETFGAFFLSMYREIGSAGLEAAGRHRRLLEDVHQAATIDVSVVRAEGTAS